MTSGGWCLLRRLLGFSWLCLAFLKMVFPDERAIAVLHRHVGLTEAGSGILVLVVATVEACVGAGLLWSGSRGLWASVSFVLASTLLFAWLLVEPLRSHCGCLGSVVGLSVGGKGLLVLCLVLCSYALMGAELVRGRGPSTLGRQRSTRESGSIEGRGSS
jgi:hypothetical protein